MVFDTTLKGMPIGPPSQVPEPKSACRPVPSPIERISSRELPATGSLSTGRFHGFVFGKTGQVARAGNAERGRRACEDQRKRDQRSCVYVRSLPSHRSSSVSTPTHR